MRCAFHRDADALFNCYLCNNPLCVACESKLRRRSICPRCRAAIEERKAAEIAAKTKDLKCPCGFVMGLVTATAAAFAWSQVAVLSGKRFDVLALPLGAIVAYGVVRGAGEKRGLVLQQMAAALTLAGILFAYFLIFVRTQPAAYAALSPGSSWLVGALYGFPAYLSGLSPASWVVLVASIGLSYYLPRARALPGSRKPA